jgi:hypothetical protein
LVVGGWLLVVGYWQPRVFRQTSAQKPALQATSRQPPATSRQPPVTNHQSPITSHQSPATILHFYFTPSAGKIYACFNHHVVAQVFQPAR